MSTSPLMSSTSPQWDNRNRGFISPAALQQLRQASPGRGVGDVHDLPARPNPNEPATHAQDNQNDNTLHSTQPRPMPPSSQSHARTASFFSFRTKQYQDQPQDSPADAPFHNRHPSNPNSAPQTDPPTPAPQMGQSKSLGPTRSPTDQQMDQEQPATTRRPSLAGRQPSPPPLHPEIRSVVQLTLAHAHKVYFSGPLARRLERQPDGQRPLKDEGWVDVWAQLGGTTLSIWDMREVEEANKQGREVPPAYYNTTDAFVQVLGSITVPATDGQPPKKFTNVLTLNTAGSNLLLFSCPSTPALISWATALRLCAWEKSRLEEIYTAHLIRITLPGGKETHSTLQRGRMEGWVRIRVAGQTDWKRMWMVVSAASPSEIPGPSHADAGSSSMPRKKRMSSLFSREQFEDLPPRPLLSLFASPKPKDKKKALLTLRDVTQAFAVYPERPELINRSTLMKLEGLLGDEETAGGMRGREGWLLVMPELEGGNTQASEMLKWLVALHDAFELYGRPRAYTWDPRDPASMMFAYPVGPARDLLFLDRELAETMDPRDDRTSTIRSRLLSVLNERMPRIDMQARLGAPPALPPMAAGPDFSQQNPLPAPPVAQAVDPSQQLPQIPSLSLDSSLSQAQSQSRPVDSTYGRALTPITELNSARDTLADARAPGPSDQYHGSQQHASESDEDAPLSAYVAASVIYDGGEDAMALGLPATSSPPPTNGTSRKPSGDSFGKGPGSRPDSKLSPSVENATIKSQETFGSNGGVAEVMGVKLPFSPMTSPEPPSFSTNSSLSVRSPTTGNQGLPHQSPGPPGRRSRSPTTTSTSYSILTSPHSLLEKDLPSIQALQASQGLSPPSRTLMMPSPSNPVPPVPDKRMSPPPQSLCSTPVSKVTPAPQPTDPQSVFTDALFFMQQLDEKSAQPRRVPTTISEKSDSTSVSEPALPAHAPLSGAASPSQPARGGMVSEPSLSGSRIALGRKPSGARALPPSGASRGLNQDSVSLPERQHLHRVPDDDTDTMSDRDGRSAAPAPKNANIDDVNVDVLAALSFLDADPGPAPPPPKQPVANTSTDDAAKPPPPLPPSSPQPTEDPSSAGSSENVAQYKSTFAPSKQAVQRKARLQAQQAAHQAAVHRPGRANGKRGSTPRASGWNETSDEEEEEEEEEEDADSDEEPSTTGSKPPPQAAVHAPIPAPAPVGVTPIRPLRPQSRAQSPTEVATATDANPYAQLRHPRGLPPVPRPPTQGTPGVHDDSLNGTPPQRRFVSDQRSRTPDEGAPARRFSDLPQQTQTTPRHTIWTQVLDANRQPGTYMPPPEAPPQPQRDTFIQLEPTSQSMTKAFTPHGLLSAGMQDKQDRSAKRQEELARENGASLINVPNKPPPPQTGLLGAITAHERERKREGGVGAALTEREREKRLAEDRQRKLDEFQRQQLEMAQSGMFSGQFPMGINPMMGNPMMNPMMPMNPMMTGAGPMMPPANPMMAGAFMGYPSMIPGYGGQPYMFAAQQAAQAAYQQAMMAFSAGGDGMHGPSPMAPMMTGGGMGFDPRMSMMGMPMMNPGMPMGGAMGPGMGGGMGMMGGMGGMGMQMTGGSAFDARFSPNGMDDLRPPGALGGPNRSGNHSSRNSSAGQASPAGPRPVDAPDRARGSPKN